MILALDVNYLNENAAVCSGVLFENFEQESPSKKLSTVYVGKISDYTPGEFYKREMPVLLDFFKTTKLRPEIIVLDGLVHLPDGKAALGEMLKIELYKIYSEEKHDMPLIIGVAKNPYTGFSTLNKVYRGSINPLIVTSSDRDVGLSGIKSDIKNMSGIGRIPALLKEVDKECRTLMGGANVVANDI